MVLSPTVTCTGSDHNLSISVTDCSQIGSGGWLNDITIIGGQYGLNIGNQQFSMRNITISGSTTAISQIWNWGWTYSGLTISDCKTAFSMVGKQNDGQLLVESVTIIDSSISNCNTFVDTVWTGSTQPPGSGSLILENIALTNVPVAVNGPGSTYLTGTTGSMTIAAYGQGHKYTPNGPTTFQGAYSPVDRTGRLSSLLSSGGVDYYHRSKPQYQNLPASSFLSIRSQGAIGDGTTDDTTAIKNAVSRAQSANQVLFFDHGVYKVTDTIYFPPGLKVVGETYSVIMSSGSLWADKTKPVAVVQIGKVGDSGSFEWSDMVVSSQGSQPGAVLIEWNLKADRGSGMWDVHTRVGGFQGSQLQVAQCPTSARPTSNCMAAYMSMHISSSSSGAYLENCWLWTADHDLDDAQNNSTRISIFTGRGLLVEGKNVYL
jgi:glucan 1,3-beta-glucosidase